MMNGNCENCKLWKVISDQYLNLPENNGICNLTMKTKNKNETCRNFEDKNTPPAVQDLHDADITITGKPSEEAVDEIRGE